MSNRGNIFTTTLEKKTDAPPQPPSLGFGGNSTAHLRFGDAPNAD